MRTLEHLFLGFGILGLFSCLTCKQEIQEEQFGLYEISNSTRLSQLEIKAEGGIIYTDFSIEDTLSYFSDTTLIFTKADDQLQLEFKKLTLLVELLKYDQVKLVGDTEVVLDKISDSYPTEKLNGGWTLKSINNQPSKSRKPVTITIDNDKITCFLGCNRGRGKLILSGSLARVENMITTRMACDDLPVEQMVLNTLQQFIVNINSADTLILSGENQLKFLRL